MKRFRRLLLAAAAVLLLGAFLAAGCWFDLRLWHPEGHVTLRWNVEGEVERTACARRGADRVEIRAVDAWGETQALATPRCDAFEETLELRSGWYHAELTMVDGSGVPVSVPHDTERFRVLSDRSIAVATVDFHVWAAGTSAERPTVVR